MTSLEDSQAWLFGLPHERLYSFQVNRAEGWQCVRLGMTLREAQVAALSLYRELKIEVRVVKICRMLANGDENPVVKEVLNYYEP